MFQTEKAGMNMNSEHVIIVLVVFTFLVSGLCFTCIYNCVQKLVRDHKIIKVSYFDIQNENIKNESIQ